MGAFNFSFRNRISPISIEDYRKLARSALPSLVRTYVEGGADDLVTMQANMGDFSRWRLRQRCLSGVGKPRLTAVVAGTEVSMPIALAPTGLTGLSHRSGDIAAAVAAERSGTRSILSSASSYSLEEVADATDHSHWFQLYPWGDHGFVGALIDRATSAGYSALFVTVDSPVIGNREGERRAGMQVPLQLSMRTCLDMALHPRWLGQTLYRGRVVPVHMTGSAFALRRPGGPAPSLGDRLGDAAALQSRNMQGDLNWADLEWIRDRWKGRLYVKGVLDPADAARIVDHMGADGVVVSNHGGRQLDRALSAIAALPAIASEIGDRAHVYLDGGIRRGTDIAIALCLGADAVFVGRPYLYGLAAAGQTGVEHVLSILREELERAMILMGCPDVNDLDERFVHPA